MHVRGLNNLFAQTLRVERNGKKCVFDLTKAPGRKIKPKDPQKKIKKHSGVTGTTKSGPTFPTQNWGI